MSLILTYLLHYFFFFFLMIRRPPRSTLFPTRRSSDLEAVRQATALIRQAIRPEDQERFVREFVTGAGAPADRKSTRLNSSHLVISYAVFCLKKKNKQNTQLQSKVATPPHVDKSNTHVH